MRSSAERSGPSGRSSRRDSRTSIDAARVMRGERSSWLTSEAKRASRSMRDLERAGHVVERRDQHAEVGVVVGVEPGAEVAARDGLGGEAHLGERSQDAPAQPGAQRGASEHADGGRPQQHGGQGVERALHLVERHDLEVRRLDRRERQADDQLGLTAQAVAHLGGAARGDLAAHRGRDGVLAELGADLRPLRGAVLVGGAQHGARAGGRLERGEVLQELLGGDVGLRELRLQDLGVGVALAHRRGLTLLEQVLAGEPVGHAGEQQRQHRGAERERQGDPRAEPEGAKADAPCHPQVWSL